MCAQASAWLIYTLAQKGHINNYYQFVDFLITNLVGIYTPLAVEC